MSWKDKLVFGVTISAIGVFVATLFASDNGTQKQPNKSHASCEEEQGHNHLETIHEHSPKYRNNHQQRNTNNHNKHKHNHESGVLQPQPPQKSPQNQHIHQKIIANYKQNRLNYQKYLTKDLQLSIKAQIEVEFSGEQRISKTTIIDIINRAIVLAEDQLISCRDTLTAERRTFLENSEVYLNINQFIFSEHFSIINRNLNFVLKSLGIEQQKFQFSLQLLEELGQIKQGFVKDVTWNYMAETRSQNDITETQLIDYYAFQIEKLPQQCQINRNFFAKSQLEPNLIQYFLDSQVNDLAYIKFGIEEYDSLKYVQKYITNPEIQILLIKRKQLLHSLVQGDIEQQPILI